MHIIKPRSKHELNLNNYITLVDVDQKECDCEWKIKLGRLVR